MPSFQPSGASPASMRRRRSVICASIPRSILGSLAMARDSAMARDVNPPTPVSVDAEEADRDVAEADLVAVRQHGLADPLAVDEDAVEAAIVEHDDHVAARGDHGVAAGDGQVLEHHVRGRRSAQAQRLGADAYDDELVAVLYSEV